MFDESYERGCQEKSLLPTLRERTMVSLASSLISDREAVLRVQSRQAIASRRFLSTFSWIPRARRFGSGSCTSRNDVGFWANHGPI